MGGAAASGTVRTPQAHVSCLECSCYAKEGFLYPPLVADLVALMKGSA